MNWADFIIAEKAGLVVNKKRIDEIQTTSAKTFAPSGTWYRIAYLDGTSQICNNSCFIELKKTSSLSESYLIRLEATNNGARFNIVSSKVDNTLNKHIGKIRYTCDSSKTYIEVYIASGGTYGFLATLFDKVNSNGTAWKKLDFEPTSETVSGVTVLTTYDIPANARPVSDYEIYSAITWNQLTPKDFAGTTYYNCSFANGAYNITLVNPSITWARMKLASGSIAGHKIYVRIIADNELHNALRYAEEDASGSPINLPIYDGQSRLIIVPQYNYLTFQFSNYWANHTTAQLNVATFDLTLMFGAGNEPTMEEFDMMFPDSYYEYNAGTYLSTTRAQGVKLNEKLANYLPKSGGTVNGQVVVNADTPTPVIVGSNDGYYQLIRFDGNNTPIGFLGFRGANPCFISADWSAEQMLLHTGNSAKVTIQSTAPSDTSALWVW